MVYIFCKELQIISVFPQFSSMLKLNQSQNHINFWNHSQVEPRESINHLNHNIEYSFFMYFGQLIPQKGEILNHYFNSFFLFLNVVLTPCWQLFNMFLQKYWFISLPSHLIASAFFKNSSRKKRKKTCFSSFATLALKLLFSISSRNKQLLQS